MGTWAWTSPAPLVWVTKTSVLPSGLTARLQHPEGLLLEYIPTCHNGAQAPGPAPPSLVLVQFAWHQKDTLPLSKVTLV